MSNQLGHFAIFLPSLNGGGAERSMLNLAQGLSHRGHRVDLILAQARGAYLSSVPETVRIIDLKASRTLTSLPALTKYTRQTRPSVILSALDYANIVSLWAKRLANVPVKTIVNEQNTISWTSRHSARRRQQVVPLLAKLFYRWANKVVTVSEGVAQDLEHNIGINHDSLKVIYNPVITPELRTKVQMPLDHHWFNNSDIPVILAVGRLTVQKDFPTLIRAFAQVRHEKLARLMILGDGPDRPDLERLISDLNLQEDVILPGFVENPYAYMSRASLFVLSSRWEGLPTVLIEALFCKLPIVATDCPSGPREILAGGQYGYLTQVGDIVDLAQGIQAGLSGEISQPPQESWAPYSLEAIVDEYLTLFLEN